MHCPPVASILLAAAVAIAQDPPPTQPAPAPTPDAAPAAAKAPAATADSVRDLAWRNLGPCNPMGRITDIEVPALQKTTWYIGTGGGGVWKTDNAGTTWTSIFDHVGNASIGDVATAPNNPDIVWVGTGEENARNSVQWGDGVYKSTDAGKTFTSVGLRETFQIGHIAIHPSNADVVYVAALGRLWGENEERGVFRTRDGGKTWEKVLYLDNKTGCIDVRIDSKHPDTVYAVMYERKRDIFDGNDPAVRFGDKAGLYRSDDGGDNWHQLTNGLPSCKWGRAGICLFEQNPDVVFAIIESERSGWATGSRQRAGAAPAADAPAAAGAPGAAPSNLGPRQSAVMGIGSEGKDGGADAPGAVLTEITEGGAAAGVGIKPGDRIVKMNGEDIKTYADLTELLNDSRGGDTVKVTYVRDTETKTVDLTYGRRDTTGGFGNVGNADYPNGSRLFGQLEGRQDRQGPDGFETGGVFRSDDRGETWKRLNSLTERPFYYSIIAVDARSDQNLYCVGTTLWGSSDGGKKFAAINRGIHVDFHAIWCDPTDSDHLLAGCDGGVNETFDRGQTWQVHAGFSAAQYYDVVADNSVPYKVIGGLQDNGTWVGPSRTRNREGITREDWVTVMEGDGFGAQSDPLEPWIVYATSQNGALGIVDLRTGDRLRLDRARPDKGTPEFNWDAPFILSPHNRLVLYHAGNFVYRGDRYSHLDNRANREGYNPLRNRDAIRMTVISPQLGLSEHGTAVSIAESPRVRGLLYVGTDDGALWRTDDGGVNWKEIHKTLTELPAPRYVSDIVPSHFHDGRVYITCDGHRFDDLHTYVFVSDDKGDTWRSLADDLPTTEPCYAVMEDPRNEDLLFLGTEYGCHVSLDRGDHWFPLGKNLPTVAVRDLFIQDRDSDLVAATHGRGVWVVDIEPLRQWQAEFTAEAVHLFAPKDAILWQMTSRGLQGARDYRAPNPPYGTTIYLHCRPAPAEAPVVTIHDVTGAQIAELTGRTEPGLQALQWDARAGNRLAGPGAYSARLKGSKQLQVFRLHPDPIVDGNAAEHATENQDR